MNTVFRFSLLLVLMLVCVKTTFAQYIESTYYNDFRLTGLTVPVYEIIPAGPPRDGIPAVDHPQFTEATQADFLTNADEVVGVFVNGVAKAYPVRILGYHEVVNDKIGNAPVAVTFNPLCASAMAYKAQANKQPLAFGTSGLVLNSNTLFYDKQTESLWSQATGEAIAGPASGMKMELLPTAYVTWGEWREKYPESLVMTTETGHQRNYACVPYEANSNRLLFPVNQVDKRLPLKERVVGIEVDGRYKAYPHAMLANGKKMLTEDEFNGKKIVIQFNNTAKTALVTDAEGNLIPSATMYWFSWFAFHPQTEVHGMAPNQAMSSMSYLTNGMP